MEIIILLALFVFVILLAEIWYYEPKSYTTFSWEIQITKTNPMDRHKMLRTYAREE